MPRKRVYKIDPHKDPLGFLEQVIMPKALTELQILLSRRVATDHRQYIRSLTIKRAAVATAINGYVALKALGLQNRNSDVLAQILEKIKKYDGVPLKSHLEEIRRLGPTINGEAKAIAENDEPTEIE